MVKCSDRVIVISKKENSIAAIKTFIEANSLEEEIFQPNISTIDYITDLIKQHNSLAWIKKFILQYLQEKGYPLMTILDLRIKTDLADDHEGLKFLRSFMLSFILIIQIDSLKEAFCNLFIITDESDYKLLKDTIKEPRFFFRNLKTNDEKINSIIDKIKNDQSVYNKNFNIFISNGDANHAILRSELLTFLNMVKAKEKLRNKVSAPVNKTISPDNSVADAADIIYKFNDSFYINGEITTNYPYDLKNEEIYINGNFTSFTRLEVITRLLALVRKGPKPGYNINKKKDLIINITQGSKVDITTPVTLAQLISNELREFKSVKIYVPVALMPVIEESKAYSMIQKNIVVS